MILLKETTPNFDKENSLEHYLSHNKKKKRHKS